MLEHIDKIFNYGVPTALVFAGGYAAFKILRWFGEKIVLPLKDTFVNHITTLDDHITKQTEMMEAHSTMIGEQTTLLKEHSEMLKELCDWKKGVGA